MRRSFLALLSVLFCGIGFSQSFAAEMRLSQPELVKAVLTWLDCDECFEHQFDYLVSLGPQVKPVLEAARDQQPPFDAIINERRAVYLADGRRVASLREGLDLATTDADERRTLKEFAENYADHFIAGDVGRYSKKAKKALRKLARRVPERPRRWGMER